MRRLARAVFYAAAVVFWVGALFMVLEVYQAGVEWSTENRNPHVGLVHLLMVWPSLVSEADYVPVSGVAIPRAERLLDERLAGLGLVYTESQRTYLGVTFRLQTIPGAFERMWLTPFYLLRPNCPLTPCWSTNSLGFRDREIKIPKPANLFRIICIGGSTTQEGPTNETTYPKLLEQMLNAHFQGRPPIEVINCGVDGMNSNTERRRIKDYLALEPDLAVEYGVVNDICPPLFLKWAEAWQREAPWWQRGLRYSAFWSRKLEWVFLPNDADAAEDFKAFTLANLSKMGHAFRQRGIPMAVCSFACPDLARLDRRERAYLDWHLANMWESDNRYSMASYIRLVALYSRLLKPFCQENGLEYVPVAEGLSGGLDTFCDVCHMWPDNIRRKAELVFEHLKGVIESRIADAGGPGA